MSAVLLHKIGSKAAKLLIEAIPSLGKVSKKTSYIINYGLIPSKLRAVLQKKLFAPTTKIINKNVGYSKYKAVKIVEKHNITVPVTKLSLGPNENPNDFLLKKFSSCGGKGIKVANRKAPSSTHYYQKNIDKKYELRVHAFAWLPLSDWVVQKRTGLPDQIAWNFSNGGKFSTFRSKKIVDEVVKISEKVLKCLGMDFGAIDFLVDNKGIIYFIEINSQPGFNGLSDKIYIDAFSKLNN